MQSSKSVMLAQRWENTMRKGLAYLDLAERYRKLASQLDDRQNKRELEEVARSWEKVAAQRAKELSKKASSKKAARKSK
jgi:hypothetical protein